MKKRIMVFRREILNSIGGFQGFTFEVDKYLSHILNPENNFFLEREKAENDRNYKQLIPYIVLRFNDTVFTYTRGSQSVEGRLRGKRSIGLGGHIEQSDSKNNFSNHDVYLFAAHREVFEEVKIESDYSEHIVALINDDSTDVGKVHFGILHIWDLFAPSVRKREQLILDEGFLPICDLMNDDNFEKWSEIAITILKDFRTPKYKF